jgi:hypothetical protein
LGKEARKERVESIHREGKRPMYSPDQNYAFSAVDSVKNAFFGEVCASSGIWVAWCVLQRKEGVYFGWCFSFLQFNFFYLEVVIE